MSVNTAEFMRSFDASAKVAKQDYHQALRGVALQMFGSIVLRTPVDTGRARGNWQIEFNKTPTGEVGTAESWTQKGSEGVQAPTESRTSIAVTNEAQNRIGYGDKEFNSIVMANNLPYINRLETGWSDQAPAGMVRITLTEFEAALRKAASEVKK